MEVSSEIGSGGRGTYMSVTRLSETTLAWCYTEADNAGAACQQLRLVSAGLRRVRGRGSGRLTQDSQLRHPATRFQHTATLQQRRILANPDPNS